MLNDEGPVTVLMGNFGTRTDGVLLLDTLKPFSHESDLAGVPCFILAWL